MRLTVGPLPPAVYWRRRAIVLSGVLLALFLVAQACMSASASPENRSSNEPSDPPSPTLTTRHTPPTGSPAGSPRATPTGGTTTGPAATGNPTATAPPDPDACTDAEMLVTAVATRTEFAAGTSVRFTIRIRNDSDRACNRDIGGDLRELYLRAAEGGGKVWSSRDCDPPSGTDVQELPPGFAAEFWADWTGEASDSCDGAKPAGEQVPPGDYELVARLGTAYSEPVPIAVTAGH
jgi:hypothetical protein